MEEILDEIKKYFKEKLGDTKLVKIVMEIMPLGIIYFPIKEMYKTFKLTQVRDYYNLTNSILGINNINEYKLLFFVTILIILFIVVKTLYKDIISRILVSFLFSLMYNFILFLLIFIYLNEDENFLIKFLLNNIEYTFFFCWFIICMFLLKDGDLEKIYNFIKKFSEVKEKINRYKKKKNKLKIIFLQIKRKLRKINQNLKAVSRLIKIQRFFTILAFSLIIWISISSVLSMISQNPSKKKIYSYLQGDNGIIKVVVYKISENYITQNAKIIENYNGKILILDTRSFYIINKEGIYNEEIKVENFNNIIRGAVINDDEAKIILEKLQDNNSLNELKKMLEVFIGKIYIKK